MNEAQFKDPVSHMCLTGCYGSILVCNTRGGGFEPFNVMINIFITEFSKFSETFRKNSNDLETDRLTNI